MKKNDRIESRLVKAFAVTTSLTALAAVITLIALIITSVLYTNALNDYGFAQGDIGKAIAHFSEARSATRTIIGYQDENVIADAVKTHDEHKEAFEKSMKEVEKSIVTDKARKQYNEIQSNLDEYWELDASIISLGNTTDIQKSTQAQTNASQNLAPQFNEIYNTLSDMMNTKVTAGDEEDAILSMMVWVIALIVIIIVAAVMLFSIKTGKKLAKQIGSSLSTVSARIETFAAGDLSSEFPEFERKDEINDMAITIKAMAENLKTILTDLSYGLSSVANGNFLAKSSCPELYVGEFETMKTSLEGLILKMRETLLQINEASEQVDAGSNQLAESATALAEGAMEQAGAVEELTATIQNVTAASEMSAKQVDDAYKEGLSYRKEAELGSEEMTNLISAMVKISEASKEIENIIAEIEDIASQTNLLSLNASIEAARAGESGKGFAVVADQIGKLATDSAESAVRTRALIQNALEEIEQGNTMTNKTKETLEQIVNGIEFLSDTSKNASESSYSQVETMQEVEKGIEQISSVVQNNSATAQETSATSQELAAQATSLKELIGQFTLK